MKRRNALQSGLALSISLLSAAFGNPRAAKASSESFEVTKTDAEWRTILSPEAFEVLRHEATEPPFRNAYFDNKAEGLYKCAGCQQPLFSSEAKYSSGTGWPSFWQPIAAEAIGTKTDWKLIVPRTEVHCARCGGHLGHVFKDGPQPTGLRYCLNSAALNFVPA
ncbi:peptide-methionine (R)-S-oxide reductase MsrB [Synechococcus sp. PCC 7336]|uniref:peptide-methionine (R)-S-oxide reductase MsrB n=1 Tax=Synechococcus sp. PCC 7336 TaxID=195250 RepID=UPI00037C1732|nr:peptide-methionine (R)-S-oxide reductase MsrB [Synechococcus sp. PCC 7336]